MDTALTLGRVQVTAFTDVTGPFPVKISHLFPEVTPEQWAPYREAFPDTFVDADTWQVHIGSYLIRTPERTVLVDTGLGPAPPPFFGELRGHLPDSLAAAGVAPESIDTVLLTHLHPDHVGWNLTASAKPVFPKARYVAHQADWDTFQNPNVQRALGFEFVDKTITPLQKLGLLDLVSGEARISDEIMIRPSPGHTPGHICVAIASEGAQALILGDAIVHAAQVSEPDWRFSFDMDAEAAAATRKRLLDQVEREGTTVLQCHFPSPGVGLIVRRDGGRRRWKPISG